MLWISLAKDWLKLVAFLVLKMSITFKKNGIFHYGDLVENKNIIKILQYDISLEENITLKDIFTVVEKYPKLKKFIKKLCSVELINDYHVEAFKSCQLCHKGNLIFKHHYDIMAEEESFSTFQIYVDDDEKIINLLPIKEIANMPININFLSVFSSDKIEKIYKYKFSLLDFLMTIYNEISFYGSDEAKEKLRSSIKS